MSRSQRYLKIALGVLLLVFAVTAQDADSQQDSEGQQADNGQGQSEKSHKEMLSLVEYEFYQMDPMMFTAYGEEFVDSINNILKKQKVNSSVVGVLVNEQKYEKSTTVATLILSYLNETILSQLGDIETYIAQYLYNNHKNFSLQAVRVTSVHSRKVSTMSNDGDQNHKGWVFVAGTSSDSENSKESKLSDTVATVRYSKMEFTLAHGHSFGYGVDKRSVTEGREEFPKEIAELDDDFFVWNKFKIFHMRDSESVSEGTNGWKSMTWSESSIQKSAHDTWLNNDNGQMDAGVITGTILGVVVVAAAAIGVVGFVLYRRRRHNPKPKETPIFERESNEGTGGVNEQTALV